MSSYTSVLSVLRGLLHLFIFPNSFMHRFFFPSIHCYSYVHSRLQTVSNIGRAFDASRFYIYIPCLFVLPSSPWFFPKYELKTASRWCGSLRVYCELRDDLAMLRVKNPFFRASAWCHIPREFLQNISAIRFPLIAWAWLDMKSDKYASYWRD